MNNIYIPTQKPEDWKHLLGEPDKHWKEKYSAYSLAHSWEEVNGFPKEVKAIFDKYGAELKDLEILFAVPEFKVELNNSKAPSQNDLFVLAKNEIENIVIMVEGKVDEPFDKTVNEWNVENKDSRNERLNFLTNELGIQNSTELGNLRYQLFHRCVSSILTAKKFHTNKAVMLIHSFSEKNSWFEDYQKFIEHLSAQYGNQITPSIDKIYKLHTLQDDITLYVGWVKGRI